MDRRRMDEKEEDVKEQRWKTRDGERKSMDEMRIGVRKKWGEGISGKAKKGRGGRKIIIQQRLSENSICIKVQLRKHHMALGTDHFHDVK